MRKLAKELQVQFDQVANTVFGLGECYTNLYNQAAAFNASLPVGAVICSLEKYADALACRTRNWKIVILRLIISWSLGVYLFQPDRSYNIRRTFARTNEDCSRWARELFQIFRPRRKGLQRCMIPFSPRKKPINFGIRLSN